MNNIWIQMFLTTSRLGLKRYESEISVALMRKRVARTFTEKILLLIGLRQDKKTRTNEEKAQRYEV